MAEAQLALGRLDTRSESEAAHDRDDAAGDPHQRCRRNHDGAMDDRSQDVPRHLGSRGSDRVRA
jgi:hypothetical protein